MAASIKVEVVMKPFCINDNLPPGSKLNQRVVAKGRFYWRRPSSTNIAGQSRWLITKRLARISFLDVHVSQTKCDMLRYAEAEALVVVMVEVVAVAAAVFLL